MDSRRSSRLDLKAQLDSLGNKIDSNLSKRSSQYVVNKPTENGTQPLRNSLYQGQEGLSSSSSNQNFVKELSDNLLQECRTLQKKLEESQKNVQKLESQQQHLNQINKEIDSKNFELQNELEIIKEDMLLQGKDPNSVRVNEDNNVILSQQNYKDLLHNNIQRVSKEDLANYMSSKYNLKTMSHPDFQKLIKPMDESNLKTQAEKLGYMAIKRQKLDLLKAKSESPDSETIKKVAATMGLHLINNKELENLKNPSKSELEKKIKKIGYVMLSENSINNNTSNNSTPVPSPLKARFPQSSRVTANREFFEQVIREENAERDVVLESGRSLGFVRLSTDQYKKLMEGQKERVLTKTDIYAGAKDFHLTVLPNDEYKNLLKRKNYTESLSFDDLNDFANKLQLKLIPAAKTDKSNRNSEYQQRGSIYSFANNSSRSIEESTDSLTQPHEAVERKFSEDSNRNSQITNPGKLVLQNDKNHDEASPGKSTIPNKITFDFLQEHCDSMGYAILTKEELETLQKPMSIESLKEQVMNKNMHILTPQEYTRLQSKEHLAELLGKKVKVLSAAEFEQLNKPKPVSLELVKEYVMSNNLKLLPEASYESLTKAASKPETKEKTLKDFSVPDVKQFLESTQSVVIVDQDKYTQLSQPKEKTLDELVSTLNTTYPEKVILDKAEYSKQIKKQSTLEEMGKNLDSMDHVAIHKNDLSQITEQHSALEKELVKAKEEHSVLKEELKKAPTELPLNVIQEIAKSQYACDVIPKKELVELKEMRKPSEKTVKSQAKELGLVVLPAGDYFSMKSTMKNQEEAKSLSIENLQSLASEKGHQLVTNDLLADLKTQAASKQVVPEVKELSRNELMKKAFENGYSMMPQEELKEMEEKLKELNPTPDNIEDTCSRLGFVAVPEKEYVEIMEELVKAQNIEMPSFDLNQEAKKKGLVLISEDDFNEIKERLDQSTSVPSSTAKGTTRAVNNVPSSPAKKDIGLGIYPDSSASNKATSASTGRSEGLSVPAATVPTNSNLQTEADKLGLTLLSKEAYQSYLNFDQNPNTTSKGTYNIEEEANKQGLVVMSQTELGLLKAAIREAQEAATFKTTRGPSSINLQEEARRLGYVLMSETDVNSFRETIEAAHHKVEMNTPSIVQEEAKKLGLVVMTQEHVDSLKEAIEEAQNSVKQSHDSKTPIDINKEAKKQGLVVMSQEYVDSLKEAIEEAQTIVNEQSETATRGPVDIYKEAEEQGLIVLTQEELDEVNLAIIESQKSSFANSKNPFHSQVPFQISENEEGGSRKLLRVSRQPNHEDTPQLGLSAIKESANSKKLVSMHEQSDILNDKKTVITGDFSDMTEPLHLAQPSDTLNGQKTVMDSNVSDRSQNVDLPEQSTTMNNTKTMIHNNSPGKTEPLHLAQQSDASDDRKPVIRDSSSDETKPLYLAQQHDTFDGQKTVMDSNVSDKSQNVDLPEQSTTMNNTKTMIHNNSPGKTEPLHLAQQSDRSNGQKTVMDSNVSDRSQNADLPEQTTTMNNTKTMIHDNSPGKTEPLHLAQQSDASDDRKPVIRDSSSDETKPLYLAQQHDTFDGQKTVMDSNVSDKSQNVDLPEQSTTMNNTKTMIHNNSPGKTEPLHLAQQSDRSNGQKTVMDSNVSDKSQNADLPEQSTTINNTKKIIHGNVSAKTEPLHLAQQSDASDDRNPVIRNSSPGKTEPLHLAQQSDRSNGQKTVMDNNVSDRSQNADLPKQSNTMNNTKTMIHNNSPGKTEPLHLAQQSDRSNDTKEPQPVSQQSDIQNDQNTIIDGNSSAKTEPLHLAQHSDSSISQTERLHLPQQPGILNNQETEGHSHPSDKTQPLNPQQQKQQSRVLESLKNMVLESPIKQAVKTDDHPYSKLREMDGFKISEFSIPGTNNASGVSDNETRNGATSQKSILPVTSNLPTQLRAVLQSPAEIVSKTSTIKNTSPLNIPFDEEVFTSEARKSQVLKDTNKQNTSEKNTEPEQEQKTDGVRSLSVAPSENVLTVSDIAEKAKKYGMVVIDESEYELLKKDDQRNDAPLQTKFANKKVSLSSLDIAEEAKKRDLIVMNRSEYEQLTSKAIQTVSEKDYKGITKPVTFDSGISSTKKNVERDAVPNMSSIDKEEYKQMTTTNIVPHIFDASYDESCEESYIEEKPEEEKGAFNVTKFEDVAKKHSLVVLSRVKYNKLMKRNSEDPYDYDISDESEDEMTRSVSNDSNKNSRGVETETESGTDTDGQEFHEALENVFEAESIAVTNNNPGKNLLNKDIITEKAKEFGLIAIEESEFRDITQQLASQVLTPEEIILKAREYGLVSIEKEQFEEIKEELENPQLNKEQLARIALEQHNLILIDKNEYRDLKRSEVGNDGTLQSNNRGVNAGVCDSPAHQYSAGSRTNSLIQVHKSIRHVSLSSNANGPQRQNSVSSSHYPSQQSYVGTPNGDNGVSPMFVPPLQSPAISRTNRSMYRTKDPKQDYKEEARKNGYLCLPESCYIAPSSATTATINPLLISEDGDPSGADNFPIDSSTVVILPKEHYTALLECYTNTQTRMISGPSESASVLKRVPPPASSPLYAQNQTTPQFDEPATAVQPATQVARDDASVNTNTSALTTNYNVIAALTQTVIGEYLHKYYPKFGILTKVRHERYFWIHPYTMTLYWSHSNPALQNGANDGNDSKTKGCAIIDVSSVQDSNPYPPGLYHRSIIIKTDSNKNNKEIKITCSTKARHNIWFNSLKYLVESNNHPRITSSSSSSSSSSVAYRNFSSNSNEYGNNTQADLTSSANTTQLNQQHSFTASRRNSSHYQQNLRNASSSTMNDKNTFFFVNSLANETGPSNMLTRSRSGNINSPASNSNNSFMKKNSTKR